MKSVTWGDVPGAIGVLQLQQKVSLTDLTSLVYTARAADLSDESTKGYMAAVDRLYNFCVDQELPFHPKVLPQLLAAVNVIKGVGPSGLNTYRSACLWVWKTVLGMDIPDEVSQSCSCFIRTVQRGHDQLDAGPEQAPTIPYHILLRMLEIGYHSKSARRRAFMAAWRFGLAYGARLADLLPRRRDEFKPQRTKDGLTYMLRIRRKSTAIGTTPPAARLPLGPADASFDSNPMSLAVWDQVLDVTRDHDSPIMFQDPDATTSDKRWTRAAWVEMLSEITYEASSGELQISKTHCMKRTATTAASDGGLASGIVTKLFGWQLGSSMVKHYQSMITAAVDDKIRAAELKTVDIMRANAAAMMHDAVNPDDLMQNGATPSASAPRIRCKSTAKPAKAKKTSGPAVTNTTMAPRTCARLKTRTKRKAKEERQTKESPIPSQPEGVGKCHRGAAKAAPTQVKDTLTPGARRSTRTRVPARSKAICV